MKKGNLVFCQGNGIMSKIIRFFDKGTYSHVAIAVDIDSVIEAEYDTKVAHRELDLTEYNLITVADFGLSDDEAEVVINEAQKLIGKRYDYLQLVGYILSCIFKIGGKNRLNNPEYMICSELAFIVMRESGVLADLGIEDDFFFGEDLTPNQLYDLVEYTAKSIEHYNIKN